MTFPEPSEVLPHRAPFLFLDEILDLKPCEYGKATWALTGDEFWFPGHFPGRPTLPGVLMCEAIAQMGAYTVLCLLYTSPSPRDQRGSRMPSSA